MTKLLISKHPFAVYSLSEECCEGTAKHALGEPKESPESGRYSNRHLGGGRGKGREGERDVYQSRGGLLGQILLVFREQGQLCYRPRALKLN